MKKATAIALILALSLSILTGCQKHDGSETTGPSPQEIAGSTGATENTEQTAGSTEATVGTSSSTEAPTEPAQTQPESPPTQAAAQPTQAATQPTQPPATEPTQPSTQPATQPATQPSEEPRNVTSNAKLKDLVIVANSKNWTLAQSLSQGLKEAFGVTLPVINSTDFQEKGAIYVGVRDYNTYGGTRYSVVTDKATVSIYLNGSDECLDEATAYLLANIDGNGNYPYGLQQEYIGYRYDRSAAEAKRYEGFDVPQPSVQQTPVGSGVTMHTMTYTYKGNPLKAYAVVLSAGSSAKVKVVAAPWDETNNASNPVKVSTVGQFRQQLMAQGDNVLAICNGSFFKRSEGSNLPMGAQIIDGNVLQAPSNDDLRYTCNWFGVTTDGRYVIANANGYEGGYKGKLQYAAGGGLMLMQSGKPTFPAMQTPAYLTCIGVTKSGGVILLSMERTPSYALAIRAFMDLGLDVTYILNMDGGGSATLYTSQCILSGSQPERAVANAIAIVG